MSKLYKLVGADGMQVLSETPGTLGGHRRNKVYGRLNCAGAARWIAKGHYVKHRVFFADEATATAAGYRPCFGCMREEYRAWRASTAAAASASGSARVTSRHTPSSRARRS